MHFCRFIGLWIRVPWCSSCPCAARLGWSSRHNRWLTASARRTPAPIQRNCLIVMLKNELFKKNWFNFIFVQLCLFNFSLVWVLEYEPDSQQNIWRKTLPTDVIDLHGDNVAPGHKQFPIQSTNHVGPLHSPLLPLATCCAGLRFCWGPQSTSWCCAAGRASNGWTKPKLNWLEPWF